MRRVRLGFCVVLPLLCIASPASALLTAVDLLTAGDKLGTFDNDTGLIWLDLTETVDTGSDPETVLASLNPALGPDWRYASAEEVCVLFENAGVGASCVGFAEGDIINAFTTNRSETEALIALLGDTSSPGPTNFPKFIGQWLFGSPGDPPFGQAAVSAPVIGSVSFIIEGRRTLPGSDKGHFLVRPEVSVPTMGSVALVAIAMLILAAAALRARAQP